MKETKQKLTASTKDIFKKWNDKSSIRKGDSATTILKKIFYRIGGLVLMTLFSPLILLVVIIVVLVAL